MDARVPLRVSRAHQERFHRVLAAPRGHIDLREVEIELRLVALHAQGIVAEILRFRPFAFRARQSHAEVGFVEWILFFELAGALDMR